MKDQHTLIKGYRDLNETEIDTINEIKEMDQEINKLVDHVKGMSSINQRWAEIAKTHLQQGIMALVRSVAKPR